MKRLLLSLFILVTHFVYAQEVPDFPDMRSWMINSNDSDRYVFADTAYVRVTPDTKQAPLDTLFAGDNITVSDVTTNGLTIRGLKGPWLSINYIRNGVHKSGYIWQGLVSCKPMRRGDVKFVYGIERRADSIYRRGKNWDTIPRFLVKLKVIRNGTILAKATLTTYDDESANTSEGKVMSGMGLANVQNIVVLSFSGEACGIPTLDYYFAWTNNNQLVRLSNKMNVVDAGSLDHSETFTFPNEKNGKPDRIIWNMINEEASDKIDKHGEYIMEVTDKKTTTYIWDGVNGTISKSMQ